MLTAKQRALLTYLNGYLEEHKLSPSFDEMRAALGLASKSGVHRLISALEERGYIRRLPNRARAIEILRLDSGAHEPKSGSNVSEGAGPEVGVSVVDVNATPSLPLTGSGGDANVVHVDFTRQPAVAELPLLGRIAAGTPIEALSDPTNHLSVPADMLGSGEHFALEIVGDSMVEAGIHDGDTVIIKRTNQALNGEIVVALIEEQEATLKTFRKESDRVALEPANRAYETRYFTSDKVRIQGKLTGLIRRY